MDNVVLNAVNALNADLAVNNHVIDTKELFRDITTDYVDLNEQIYNRIMDELSKVPIVHHKCHNCGATVKMDENKHIFICPYCDSTYAVGTSMVNDKGTI